MGRHKSPARKRPDPITEKQCSHCGEIKDVSLFGKYYGGKMGERKSGGEGKRGEVGGGGSSKKKRRRLTRRY